MPTTAHQRAVAPALVGPDDLAWRRVRLRRAVRKTAAMKTKGPNITRYWGSRVGASR